MIDRECGVTDGGGVSAWLGWAAARRGAARRAAVRTLALSLLVAGGSMTLPALGSADEHGEAKPVRWDQERVTGYAVELAAAVGEARQAVRQSPLDQQLGQRQVQFDLREEMRLVENTAKHLSEELQEGKGREETLSTFRRLGSLRLRAEELGRRALIEEMVMDALVKAGELHNRMKPYYEGLK